MSDLEHLSTEMELSHQLQLFRVIYSVTEALADLCAQGIQDQKQIDKLLSKRQQIMDEITQFQQDSVVTNDEGGLSPEIKNLHYEMRSVLQKTAILNKKVTDYLQVSRDKVKKDILMFQAEKKAGVLYKKTSLQSEGFFIDSKKN
ncbi:hypothetical protein [Dethiobacter alkaliphilus]|uniref:FlgN family protein n=1 Tax=Dethiobacter alkaliphilus AHT 1 TaxID=555088 RepID=C0GJJ9_DETAL|nr:hypothetical protein [Dethiobacter alkaliphilus]EEG76546.1 hypothetical protein DealDRAFT_2658 [Dethiobacter alkaliphilus AHT 1]